MNPYRRDFIRKCCYIAAAVGVWPTGIAISNQDRRAISDGGYIYNEKLRQDLLERFHGSINPPTKFIPFA